MYDYEKPSLEVWENVQKKFPCGFPKKSTLTFYLQIPLPISHYSVSLLGTPVKNYPKPQKKAWRSFKHPCYNDPIVL